MPTPQENAEGLIQQLNTTDSVMRSCARKNAKNGFGRGEQLTPHGLVLAHGIGRYCIRDRWAGVRRGRMQMCYKNATKLMTGDPERWIYCEGYAIRGEIGFVVGAHAFLLDRNNGFEVVDPTWRNTKAGAYLGVPINPRFVLHQMIANRSYGLLDNWPNLPLLSTPVEDWLHSDASSIPSDFVVPQDREDPWRMLEEIVK